MLLRSFPRVLSVVLGVLLTISSVHAQETNKVLPELLDAERAFQVAKSAAEAGDFRTAIAALERVLLINPELANIQYELALLYKKVGAQTRAKYYLQEALKSPAMPEVVRNRAELELAELSGGSQSNRGQFYGALGIGVQYDTNALSVSEQKQLVVGNEQGEPEIQISPEESDLLAADVVGNLGLSGGYRLRFGRGGLGLWDSSVSLITSQYVDFSDESDSTATVSTSVRLPFSQQGQDVKPFIRVSQSLEDDTNEPSLTAGVTLRNTGPTHLSSFTLQGTESDEEYTTTAGLSLSFSQSASFSNTFNFSASTKNAREKFDSYQEVGVSYTASKRLGAVAMNVPVSANFTLGYSTKQYEGLLLGLDPIAARSDNEGRVSLIVSAPISNRLSVSAGVRYTNNRSSIVNYEYDNIQALANLNWRF